MSGLLALFVLAFVHLFANQVSVLGWVWHGRFLSFAAGVSFSYVFVDLLPALEKGQPALRRTLDPLIPYLDRHAYLIALLGVLFFYGVHTQSPLHKARSFWVSVAGYVLFNLFVGASLADSTNPDIQPVLLFTIAMAMHYFIRDHQAEENNAILYGRQARWILVAALFVGYAIGYMSHIPDAVVAIVVSFLAGGVILNALRYELPKREQVGYAFFVTGALFYTGILLSLG